MNVLHSRWSVVTGLAVVAVLLALGPAAPRAAGTLAWSGRPRVFTVPDLPGDRVLVGEVVNGSGRVLVIDARRILVRDRAGRPLDTAARFLSAFAHSLYAPFQFPGVGSPYQLQRLGVVVRMEPGQRLPLTVSWRRAPGDAAPVSVDLGAASLSIPGSP